MKILCIGDIVGKPGRQAICDLLPEIKREYSIDFVIANGENVAGGAGITPKLADAMLEIGCDVITLGDHVWDQKELEEYLKESDSVLRALNFPQGAPGRGFTIKELPNGKKVCVISLLGRVFVRHQTDCPFRALDKVLEEVQEKSDIIIVDFHAEATSEKKALGHFADGRVCAVVGTHTHVQTADEAILPKGTAYITDLGMTGPHDSVIGQDKEKIIERFLTSMPIRFNVADKGVMLNGVIITVDDKNNSVLAIERVQKAVTEQIKG